jgi:magnesium transporter
MIACRVFRNGTLEREAFDPAAVSELLAGRSDPRVWLDVDDPSEDELALIAREFGLHPLAIEDTRQRDQRPKVEAFAEHVFVVIRPVGLGADMELIEHEIHAFVSPRFLVTLRYAPVFEISEAVRRAERQPELTTEGAAFLLYLVLDEVVDGYLTLVDRFEDRADELEDDVFATADETGDELQQRLFVLKRDVVRFRRHVMPLRRVVDFFLEQPQLVPVELMPYYRDVADHVVRCIELTDNIRDLLTSLLEVRIAQAANRLNEVMKKLTSWAGIILIPTLIAGIYGMNFRNMPELGWRWGYGSALGLMAASSFALWRLFKRKDWL